MQPYHRTSCRSSGSAATARPAEERSNENAAAGHIRSSGGVPHHSRFLRTGPEGCHRRAPGRSPSSPPSFPSTISRATGDRATVTLILRAGVEHTFEPKPGDMARVDSAQLFVYTGRYMEPWSEELLKVANRPLSPSTRTRGIRLMKSGGEHHTRRWKGAWPRAL